MTQLLEQAFKKASSLPEDLQNSIAQVLINEMEWDKQWIQLSKAHKKF